MKDRTGRGIKNGDFVAFDVRLSQSGKSDDCFWAILRGFFHQPTKTIRVSPDPITKEEYCDYAAPESKNILILKKKGNQI